MASIKKFFHKHTVRTYDRVTGLNMSDHAIRVVELVRDKNHTLTVTGKGSIDLDPGLVRYGRIIDQPKVEIAVRKLFTEVYGNDKKPEHLVVSLPESQTYAHAFMVRKEDLSRLDEVVMKEVHSYIPLPKDDVLFSYRTINQDKEGELILLVATSREVVEEWQLVFQGIDLKVDLFDAEHLATFRAIFSKPLSAPVCIIDIGALTSRFSIFDLHGLRYVYSADLSGKQLIEKIAEAIGKDFAAGVMAARELGLSGEDSKVTAVIKESLQPGLAEIKKTIGYFEEKMGTKVEEIVFVGSTSAVKNLSQFATEVFGLPARVGVQTVVKEDLPKGCTQALGAAYRLVGAEWELKDPAIEPLVNPGAVVVEPKKAPATENTPINSQLMMDTPDLLAGDNSEATDQEQLEMQASLAIQKKILLGIFTSALILVPGAFWYKAQQDAAKEAERKERREAMIVTPSAPKEEEIAIPEKNSPGAISDNSTATTTDSVASSTDEVTSQLEGDTAAEIDVARETSSLDGVVEEVDDTAEDKLRELSVLLGQDQGTTSQSVEDDEGQATSSATQ